MKMLRTGLIITLALLSSSLEARLGEKVEDIKARFGEPEEVAENVLEWKLADDMTLMVQFLNGKSACETLRYSANSVRREDQWKLFLDSNGTKWASGTTEKGTDVYLCRETNVSAFVERSNEKITVTVMNEEMKNYLEKLSDENTVRF